MVVVIFVIETPPSKPFQFSSKITHFR